MREIKFRAFDSISKKLHTWDVISMMTLPQFIHLEHYTLEQFTGLPDNNGVDIYEGDNVIQYIESEFLDRSDWRIIEGSVLFLDGEWCVGSTKYPLYGFPNRVIGNIHENKDLI